MRVTTYNMRQGGSRQHWSDILSATEPDLLLVQETKDPATFSGDLLEPMEIAGALWRPVAKNKWGSAIWMRNEPIDEVPVAGFEGWVTGGTTRIDGEDAFVFSVHLPPSGGSYVRSGHALMGTLGPIVQGTPCIIGGDWNFAVCRRDSGDPEGHQRGEVAFVRRMAEEFSLVPAWREAHPEGALPQTLRWMRDPQIPFHCDGIFVSTRLGAAAMTAEVLSGPPWVDLSDQNPVAVGWS